MNDGELMAYVQAAAAPLLAAREMELVELNCRRQGSQRVLQLLVQTRVGVTLDQCAELNRTLSASLEAASVLDEPYVLEVASPGLDRSLRTRRDFERMAGERILVMLQEPYAGQREFVGRVVSADEASVTLETKRLGAVALPLAQITRAVIQLRW